MELEELKVFCVQGIFKAGNRKQRYKTSLVHSDIELIVIFCY